jgi:hypothetical protein
MKPELFYAARVTEMLRAPFQGWCNGAFFRYKSIEERYPDHDICGPCAGGFDPVDLFKALTPNKETVQAWVDAVNRDYSLVGVRAELVTFTLREVP